jgi:SAM-dependent methyltransferase
VSDVIEKIMSSYEKRKSLNIKESFYTKAYSLFEREILYHRILVERFGDDFSKLKILEIGAGTGDNLLFFHRIGFSWENIYANELLPDRGKILKEKLVKADNIHIGNALELRYHNEFDIVFQSLVFTSVLDDNFRKELALKMISMVKPNGIILFYDFKYNNPANKNVKRVSPRDIRNLFSSKHIKFYSVTLAPPISRKIGRFYNLINILFPFLRTHLVSVITGNE